MTLGTSGKVVGEVHAVRVLVSGTLEGRVDSERLEIVAGGSVEGTVSVTDLVIEPGGRFNGSSEIRQHDAAPDPAKTSRSQQDDAEPDAGSGATA